MSAALDKLRAEAEKLAAKARERQDQVAAEARQAAQRQERGRAAAAAFLDTYDPQVFERDLVDAHGRLVEAVTELVEQHPVGQALVEYLLTDERRRGHAVEANNCLITLGREPRIHEPRAREIDLVTLFAQAASQKAGEAANDERETLAAARNGDATLVPSVIVETAPSRHDPESGEVAATIAAGAVGAAPNG